MSNTTENCIECKYCRKLKYNFEVGKGFKESYCCIVLLQMPDTTPDCWVQEVNVNGGCEMFSCNKDNSV